MKIIMIKFLNKNYSRTQYLVMLNLMLIGIMLALRVYVTRETKYLFLIWNLFLAALPYLFARILYKGNRNITRLKASVLLLFWLIFLPNAPYIVTDLFHLEDLPGVPLWYDLILLFSSAFIGMVLGFKSIYYVKLWVNEELNRKLPAIMMPFLHLLIAYGVYLGRYLRWNTWDIFVQPFELLKSLQHTFTIDGIAFTIIFGVFHYIIFITVLPQKPFRLIPYRSSL